MTASDSTESRSEPTEIIRCRNHRCRAVLGVASATELHVGGVVFVKWVTLRCCVCHTPRPWVPEGGK